MDRVRKEAYHIICKVIKEKHHSDALLDKVASKLPNQKEKALLYHLVKGILKMMLNLEYIAQNFNDTGKYSNTDIKIKILLYLGLYQLKYCDGMPNHMVINETVEIAKVLYGKPIADYVNAVLREFQRSASSHQALSPNDNADVKRSAKPDWIIYPQDKIQRLSMQYSFPADIISNWLKRWKEDEVEQLCRYFNEPPKLSMRVNQIATDKKRLKNYFKRKDIELQEVDISANILVTDRVQDVLSDVSFEEGYFSIQDGSAALVVELLAPHKDDNVIDMFAGPGGKCTYISEIMNNSGQVIAIDKYPQKVKRIKHAIYRLQITNMITVKEDALKYAPRASAYDKVLLDVPCTGWGVFQKKPELRWQNNQDLKSLLKLQEQSLNTGAIFVKPGGYLVYSTCTMNPQENEQQIDKFLQSNKNFDIVDASDYIPKRFTKEGLLYTFPHIHSVDGAFAAKMQKKK